MHAVKAVDGDVDVKADYDAVDRVEQMNDRAGLEIVFERTDELFGEGVALFLFAVFLIDREIKS